VRRYTDWRYLEVRTLTEEQKKHLGEADDKHRNAIKVTLPKSRNVVLEKNVGSITPTIRDGVTIAKETIDLPSVKQKPWEKQKKI
jgi:chaperonin GroEL (HSP60 family)